MATDDGEGETPGDSFDDKIDQIEATTTLEGRRAGRTGARRVGWVFAAAIPVVIAVVMLAVAMDNSDTDEVATSSATTSSSTTSTTVASTTTSSILFSTATTVDPTATTSTTGTVTTLANANCRNSTNASCGAFRWDPAPAANSPLTISASWVPNPPRVGEEVVFTVAVQDNDASPIREGACGNGSTGIAFGDGPAIATTCNTPCGIARYGPWTPPARSAGSQGFTYRHVYSAPGTYTGTLVFGSSDPCNPYASTRSLRFQVTVQP